MKRRMRPIDGTFHLSMPDRGGVDVIEMTMPIPLVSNHMLPIPSLPDAAFTLVHPVGGDAFVMWEHSREKGFDQESAHWKVIVIRRQAPQAMQQVVSKRRMHPARHEINVQKLRMAFGNRRGAERALACLVQ